MRWQEDLLSRGWNALYIENHDQPRSIDTFGNGSIESAKALAVSYMLLRDAFHLSRTGIRHEQFPIY